MQICPLVLHPLVLYDVVAVFIFASSFRFVSFHLTGGGNQEQIIALSIGKLSTKQTHKEKAKYTKWTLRA